MMSKIYIVSAQRTIRKQTNGKNKKQTNKQKITERQNKKK